MAAWGVRISTPVGGAIGAGLVAVLVCALWLAGDVGGSQVTAAVDGLTILGTAGLAAVLAGRRARATGPAEERGGWWCLAVSEALFAGGLLVTIVITEVRGSVPDGPTLADALYLPDAVAAIVAVLLFGGHVWRSMSARMLLDGGLVACTLLLLSLLTSLHTLAPGRNGLTGLLVALAYPVGDVMSASVVILTLAHYRRLEPSLVIVGAGLLLFATADSAYAYLHYPRPNLLDLIYPAANLCIAIASAVPPIARAGEREPALARWQVLLPYVPLVLTLPAVGYAVVADVLDPLGEVLTVLAVALVLARQLVTVLEAQSLAATLSVTLAEQRLLIEQAPLGITRLDADGRLLSANRALTAMLGVSEADLERRSFGEFIHPDDLPQAAQALVEMQEGTQEHSTFDARAVRGDGTTLWCSAAVGPLRDADGRIRRIVAIVEDVSDRKRTLRRAARIQRRLLPQTVPRVAGYDLAGACLPAQDVAGDFYDWVLTDDGHLDLTVADVMGKGIPAALMMAVVRTALRSAPAALTPAERVRVAESSVNLGSEEDVPFVTLFHARLEPASGVLRYVDAGHGYCAIRRAGGALVPLGGRSLPLGVQDGERFEEGTATLRPGDALLVYSDGLVEVGERTLDLAELTDRLDEPADAAGTLRRLMAGTLTHPADDVTVVVLLRHQDGVAAATSSSR